MTILSASNKAEDDSFGYATSLTDAYTLVGAPYADPGGVNRGGAAYIFFRSDLSWNEQAIITASNKASYDYFGISVSLTDNYALIGSYRADPDLVTNAGAAYIFIRSDVSWTQQAIITASDKVAHDYFGISVSLTDNYALVGRSREDSDLDLHAGAAYIYSRSGISWSEQGILTASDEEDDDNFGYAVSLTDNYALIGSYKSDPGSINDAGAAYFFVRSNLIWNEQTKITASNKAAYENFGKSVSLKENYALVGSPHASPGSIMYAGAAYVFSRYETTWTQQAIITASNKASYNSFGRSVSLTDNYALVASPDASPSSAINAGAAYVFSRYETTWTQQAIITASNKAPYDSFGYSTSLTDNYAVITSPDASPSAVDSAGAAYIHKYEISRSRSQSHSQSQSPSQSQSLTISPSPEPIQADILGYNSTRTGNFGTAVALMNSTMIASSPTCIDQSNCDGGRTAVLKKDTNGDYIIYQMLQGRHRSIDARFGDVLAVNNYWLAITSKGTTYYDAQTALVSIFGKNPDTDTIERVAGLRPKSNNQPNMDFGHSIAVGQFDIIVGVPGYDLETTIDIGAIMSFRLRISNNRWGRNPVVATAFDATAGDRFGHSISFDEAFLAVGNNPSDDTRYAVYILTKSGFEFAHVYKISGNGKRGFGWTVLLSDNELVVASPLDDNSGASANGGCVSVFAKNSTNHFVEYDTIRHTPYVAERRFAFAVARKGNRMAIGTNTCPNGAPCALQGKAYLYTKSGQQWVPRRSFSSGHVDGSDSFGTRVTIDEEDVVVGAPGSNNGSGRVYAYYVPEISG